MGRPLTKSVRTWNREHCFEFEFLFNACVWVPCFPEFPVELFKMTLLLRWFIILFRSRFKRCSSDLCSLNPVCCPALSDSHAHMITPLGKPRSTTVQLYSISSICHIEAWLFGLSHPWQRLSPHSTFESRKTVAARFILCMSSSWLFTNNRPFNLGKSDQ